MEKLLLVEDDAALVRKLKEYLSSEGFQTASAAGQTEAVGQMDADRPDLALVDITLSDGNGFAVCSYARKKSIPVIFLTASGDELNTVTGLDMGADDYVSKPFRPRELVSRIRSVLRRTSGNPSEIFVGSLRVDAGKGLVFRNGEQVSLSALEYRLFMFFLNHRGQIVSRELLLDEIWDSSGEYINDNTLTVYIKRLREKLEDDSQKPALIETVRGIGYRLKE